VAAACESTEDSSGGFETTAPAPRGSGGFSANLAKQLGSDSKDEPKPTAGSADSKPEVKDPKPEVKPDPKDAKPDAKPDPKDPKPDAKPDPKDGRLDPKPVSNDPKANPNDAKATGTGPAPIDTGKPRVVVRPSPEVAAIKISLSPNWDRDVGEAGTISLVVKIPGTENTKVFAFRYGYEDAKAPTDREAYKKWLAAQGILGAPSDGPLIDRQRSGWWYLEGVDGSGSRVWRMVAVFGGKKLICGGSSYKDAASSQLGDIRDKTVIQAKEICESLSL
jgi:hypothetical protein